MKNSLIEGPIGKSILWFTIPIFLPNLLQVCYSLADSIIVSNFVGENALGAIGVTGSFVWLLTSIATGIGTGVSIAISQYFGAKKTAAIRKTVDTGFFLSFIVGIALTVICFLLATPIIRNFLGTPESMQNDAKAYFLIYSLGLLFVVVYNVAYGILRAQGDSRGALIFLLISAIINVGLDLLFVITFQWGVHGAAAATALSQTGAAIAAVIYLKKKFPDTRLRFRGMQIDLEKIRIIFRFAIPLILQMGVSALGFVVLQRLVNSFGEASINGFTAMQKIEMLVHIPSNSFNAAITSFVGQNIGARQVDRVRKGYRFTITVSSTICIIIGILIFIFGESMLGIFNLTAASMQRGLEHLQIIAVFVLFTTVNNVTSGLLQGAGDVKVPAASGFINLGIRLACAYIMASTWINFRSIYYSLPPAWIIACVIVVLRYRSGKWQGKAIV